MTLNSINASSVSNAGNDVSSLLACARAHKAAGRLDDAVSCLNKAVALAPDNAVAAHNLASALGDMAQFEEARRWAEKAFDLGVKRPETWLVYARALQGCGRMDEAERAYRNGIALRPEYLDAYHDLAQLVWMRTADVARACRAIEVARRSAQGVYAAELAYLQAQVEIGAMAYERAVATLDRAIARWPGHRGLRIARSQLAAEMGDAETQLGHAVAALQADRSSAVAAKTVVEALLHCGRAGEARDLAERIAAAAPGDQGILALLLTACRMLGDSRYERLCEDPALVSDRKIDRPEGWSDLDAFLADLAAALKERHRWKTHPLEQSLRHGSQTQEDLTRSDHPAIAALFRAVRPVIAAHIAALGKGDDPVRSRIADGFRLCPAWSVFLRPGGFHVDHVHPQGWLSSAFYVSLPDAVRQEGKQGWLAFGRPGIPTRPKLDPVHHIRPEPGMMAIFPSYLWHGTEVFSGDQPRLTIAFDIVPA